MCGDIPHACVQWLSLAEFWYNTSYQSTIRMTPFEAMYGITPPIHIPYIPNYSEVATVDIFLRDRETAIDILKQNLTRAANRMKQLTDRKRTE